jgi:hypothetical protein
MCAAGRSFRFPYVGVARGVTVFEIRCVTAYVVVNHPITVIVQVDSYPDRVVLRGSVGEKVIVARRKATTRRSRGLGRR